MLIITPTINTLKKAFLKCLLLDLCELLLSRMSANKEFPFASMCPCVCVCVCVEGWRSQFACGVMCEDSQLLSTLYKFGMWKLEC